MTRRVVIRPQDGPPIAFEEDEEGRVCVVKSRGRLRPIRSRGGFIGHVVEPGPDDEAMRRIVHRWWRQRRARLPGDAAFDFNREV